MKQIAEHLYARGKAGNLYCHLRIPSELKAAYPPKKTHITRALGTSDCKEGKQLLVTELASIYQEFNLKRRELAVKAAQRAQRSALRLTALTDAQVHAMAGNWVHQSLLTDDLVRSKGLDDDEFESLDVQLQQQRKELGRLLAQGKVEPILPAMRSFIHLLGTEVDLSPERERQAGYKFLESVVQALDVRLERQAGRVKPSADLAPSMRVPELQKSLASGKGPTWAEVFEKWAKHVHGRSKGTVIAAQTPWRELERVARAAGIKSPGLVTKHLVNQFVEDMIERGLATVTINERLTKVKAIYKVAVGRMLLEVNPAQDVIGRGKSAREKRRKKRLPFDQNDLNTIFGCSIYNGAHERSRGSSGEASYWIPVLMYYTGARTEELAGLALDDIVYDELLGCWYLNIIDRPEPDDEGLFDDEDDENDEGEEVVQTEAHGRMLKNAASIRRVPVAQELFDLGLLRYADWVKSKGAKALFPTLKKDFHDKLSGSFSKFFGRLKKKLSIDDKRKVLYSFRHTIKDTLEAAEMPSRYLKRLMGHTTGDGVVTDGYGGDLPFDVMVRHFKTVKFRPIPAVPWEPGRGYVNFPHLREEKSSKKKTSKSRP
ncbi:MAG: DUF6538 domain-containing protein [Burkholderiales bacterium]